MHPQENDAIAIGEVRALPPPDGEVGKEGKGRILALSLDSAHPPEALPFIKVAALPMAIAGFPRLHAQTGQRP